MALRIFRASHCQKHASQILLHGNSSRSPGTRLFSRNPLAQTREKNILRSVGLKVEYGDQIDYGESRGVYKTVGDQEHLDIIDNYFERLSMGKIAKKLDRSAATVHAQIHAHNESIDKMGYCAECRRLKGTHEVHKTDSRAA